MPNNHLDAFTAILYRAMSAKYPLLVFVSDINKARQHFYKARKIDPFLHCLQIRVAPEGLASSSLLICKSKKPKLEGE